MNAIWIWFGGVMVAAVPSILSGIFLHQLKRHQKVVEEQNKERAERELLTLESLNALFDINKEFYACRMLGRTPNGELKAAFEHMQKIKHSLEDYLRRLASKS